MRTDARPGTLPPNPRGGRADPGRYPDADRSLEVIQALRDIATDADDTAIVRAIISLAERLKLNPVAEGVKNHARYEFLRREG